ncbi:MAG: glycosyltransferase [Bifidobacterium tibiigranuli]|jgi:glycosyltransferase involved in cell wall biosynthesis|uniref:glycosyltransferase n=1 Tax=Bifidobacterium tibiigranuli TaxID=2172043 RepID=UPI0026EC3046|nr:glycosyltransferase [Bifidobacterium tibiigranuli]MCI2186559.1 glycosyltransferase [Bifidobacterium tibiigranuli]
MTSVLITGLTANRGGVETLVFNYVRELAATIHFDFWCSNDRCAYEDELKALGCRFHHGTAYGLNFAQAHRDSAGFFANHANDYDALWSNKSMLVNIDDLRLAKRHGISKIILHSHNSRNMFSGASGKVKSLLHKLNRVPANGIATDFWACSQDAARYFFTKRNLMSSRYHFVPNAIDTQRFTFNQTIQDRKRLELGVGENTTVVGFVGRLQYQKDPELMMRIFIAYHANHTDSLLLVVGTGELEQRCKTIISEAGIESSVRFLGNRSDVSQLYQAMDVFCLPSRFEGLGIVLIEAQVAGLPCIIADSIPHEAVLTNLCTPVNRETSPEFWAAAIENASSGQHGRTDMNELITAAGFDIHEAAKNLAPQFGAME